MRIHKYLLNFSATQALTLPAHAIILSIQIQNGVPALWAAHNEPVNAYEQRIIDMYGTGEVMPENPGKYISTVQIHGGNIVFHFFEGV